MAIKKAKRRSGKMEVSREKDNSKTANRIPLFKQSDSCCQIERRDRFSCLESV
jgi:hypothetical protein